MNCWNGYTAEVRRKSRLFGNAEPGGNVAYFLVRDFQPAARDEEDGTLNPLDEVEIDDYGAADANEDVAWKIGSEPAEQEYHAERVGATDKMNIAVVSGCTDPDYFVKSDFLV